MNYDNIIPGPVDKKIIQTVPVKIFTHLKRGDSFQSLSLSPKHKDILPKLRRFSSPKVISTEFVSGIVRLEQENIVGDF